MFNCSKLLFTIDRISLQEHRLLLRFDKDMDICKLKFFNTTALSVVYMLRQ